MAYTLSLSTEDLDSITLALDYLASAESALGNKQRATDLHALATRVCITPKDA